jgi:two-component system, LytTR family, response regulator
MSVPHRVLVADDEPLARDRLAFLLAPHPRFAVVAQCTDGSEALRAISETKPDVAFLDIQMPGHTGLEIAEELVDQADAPLIVFVTAFDEFALKAFDVSAVDYLVKPVDRERFDQMIERVERRLSGHAVGGQVDNLLSLLEHMRTAGTYPKRFVVRDTRGHYFVRTDEIETATADGNYVRLAAGGRTHLIRETMKSFEEKVDPAHFARVHRSTIINVDRIARVEPQGHGVYRIVMASGARFESSVTYGARVQALLR